MDQYAKQKMNLEFGYIMEFYCEMMEPPPDYDDDTIEDFKRMFEIVARFTNLQIVDTEYDEVIVCMSDLAPLYPFDACGAPYYSYEYLHSPSIKIDMIKNIERNEILDVVVRPLQIKIKEMLYSPHTKRGRAFIEKQISWAFEE